MEHRHAERQAYPLIIGGGIAAYKSLELIRLLRKAGAAVTPVLTKAGAEFVTPLSVSALAGEKVYTRPLRSDG
jgi:phosphopantothenoylcysteine decarboxylase / phosphopantothenate---cysteine ligase